MTLTKSFFPLGRKRVDPYIDPSFHSSYVAHPVVLYDVGAAREIFSMLPLADDGRCKIFGFEPVEESFNDLERMYRAHEQVKIYQLALADHTGKATLNVFDTAVSTSSLLRRNTGNWRHMSCRSTEVETMRLDDVPSALDIPPPNFVKLDTEGSELVILSNSTDLLDRDVLGIFTEFSFRPIAESGAVFSDLDRLITSHGFYLFDLQFSRAERNRVGGKKGPCSNGDALYLRNFFTYDQAVLQKTGAEFARAQALRLIAISLGFRYFTYAIEVAAYAFQRGYLDKREFQRIYDRLASVTNLAEILPSFPGRKKLALIFDFLTHILYPSENKGKPNMSNAIGNRQISLVSCRVPSAIRPGLLYREFMGGSSEVRIDREPE